jgi:hypothetical protein
LNREGAKSAKEGQEMQFILRAFLTLPKFRWRVACESFMASLERFGAEIA